jgi:hypothetical protein
MYGKVKHPNGWTSSVIPGPSDDDVEVWAWHKDGRTDEDVQYRLPEDVEAFRAEVAAR